MSSDDEFSLGFNTHGKGRVRIVKVTRGGKDGKDTHYVQQINVQILLEGFNDSKNMDPVYLDGDNSTVIATDTCKNTVYCIASMNKFDSIEEFGILLVKHFLNEYKTIIRKVNIQLISDKWQRLVAPDSKGKLTPHKHSFQRIGPYQAYTKVQGERIPILNNNKKFSLFNNKNDIDINIQSGFKNLELLKTTQSGFIGFHRNKFTSLPEVEDRLLGTSAEAEWIYNNNNIQNNKIDFNKVNQSIENELVNTFAGPSDKGTYSKSVQETLYSMATSALRKESQIDKITIQMPNIHNIPFPLETYGLKNKDSTGKPFIFFPIDEPHGMIKAEVTRKSIKSRL